LLKKDRWCLKRKAEAWGSLLIRLKRPHDEDMAEGGRRGDGLREMRVFEMFARRWLALLFLRVFCPIVNAWF